MEEEECGLWTVLALLLFYLVTGIRVQNLRNKCNKIVRRRKRQTVIFIETELRLENAASLSSVMTTIGRLTLTGSKKETTLKFYEGAGYNSSDKTAFIQWLD